MMRTRWEWADQGVIIEGDRLIWYEAEGPARFASGAATEQPVADFLERGPAVGGVPSEVLAAVTDAIRRHRA